MKESARFIFLEEGVMVNVGKREKGEKEERFKIFADV